MNISGAQSFQTSQSESRILNRPKWTLNWNTRTLETRKGAAPQTPFLPAAGPEIFTCDTPT